MKRGFASLSSRVLTAVLCSILLTASAAAANDCPARNARLFVIDNENWQSGVVATTATGATIRVTDCAGSFSQFTRELAPDGATAVDDISGNLVCSDPEPFRVVELPILAGCATLATEAIFTEPSGLATIVAIPELPAPMSEGGSGYIYRGIRAAHPRAAFAFLIASPARAWTRAEIDEIDGSGAILATHLIDVDGGWAFVQLGSGIDAGTLRIRNIGPGIGPSPVTELDAIVITGYGNGGSPRVLSPESEAAP